MIDTDGLVAALDEAQRAIGTARQVANNDSDSADLDAAAKSALAAWRRRNLHLPSGLFADAEWTTLLLLAEAAGNGHGLRQIDVFNTTAVPHTTGYRIIERLLEANLIERGPGGRGPKSPFLSLSTEGKRRMCLALGAHDAS